MADSRDHDLVIRTDVPGIVIWRYPRSMSKQLARRVRVYVLTHEPSGLGMMMANEGNVRGRVTQGDAMNDARALGALTWKGKAFDWTQPADVIMKNERAMGACRALSGFVTLGKVDPVLATWGADHDVKVGF